MPAHEDTYSRFDQHLRMLAGRPAAADREEADRIAAVYLPPLRLGARRPAPLFRWREPRPFLFAAATIAALLALLVFERRPEEDALLPKGGTHVTLLWQRGDAILPWHAGNEARDGDRFSAEVVADRSLAAFLGIYDRTGRLLSDPRLMLSNHIELARGERANFSSGFELTASDEGEEAAVFTCDLAAFKAADALPFVERMVSVGGCAIVRFRLR